MVFREITNVLINSVVRKRRRENSKLSHDNSHNVSDQKQESPEAPFKPRFKRDQIEYESVPEDTLIRTGVPRYVDAIVANYKRRELAHHPPYDYLPRKGNNREVTRNMRMVLVDWLIEVHQKFKFKPHTLFLCINILDRFMFKQKKIRKCNLQMVGCCAMWVASKYHEYTIPEASDYTYISDKAFDKRQLLQCEEEMMRVLKCQFCVVTSHTFLERYLQIGLFPLHPSKRKRVANLAHYGLERAIMTTDYLKFKPSVLAASSLFCALIMSTYGTWTRELSEVTEYNDHDIQKCIMFIKDLVLDTDNPKHKAVIGKYSTPEFGGVSLLRPSVSTKKKSIYKIPEPKQQKALRKKPKHPKPSQKHTHIPASGKKIHTRLEQDMEQKLKHEGNEDMSIVEESPKAGWMGMDASFHEN